jgi:hypothetical protein
MHPSSQLQQQQRLSQVVDGCVSDLGKGTGIGYDHFFSTSESTRNAQILAQQLFQEKQRHALKQQERQQDSMTSV